MSLSVGQSGRVASNGGRTQMFSKCLRRSVPRRTPAMAVIVHAAASPASFPPSSSPSGASPKKGDVIPPPQAHSAPAAPLDSSAPSSPSRRRQLINMGGLAVSTFVTSMVGCPCCPAEAKTYSRPRPWDYSPTSQYGPNGWAGSCGIGKKQSPVDLPVYDGWAHTNNSVYGDLMMDYSSGGKGVFLTNGGHGTMQVNFPNTSENSLIINGVRSKLLQYHFHTPSEHAFDGQRYAMEVHLVHKNLATGRLTVCGVMLACEKEDKGKPRASDTVPGPPRSQPLP